MKNIKLIGKNMDKNLQRVKYACYGSNITMAIVANLSPILFLTFRHMYGISYTLLGLLVLINFTSQLLIDIIFSFFSHKFNIPMTVKIMPLIAIFGLVFYALAPYVFPNNVYVGIVIGTIIFSISSGLAEVLVSPVIASIPSENPDHEMSKLHSIYAWGVVGFVVFATLFLLAFGTKNWQILVYVLAVIPLIAFLLSVGAKLPEMEKPEKVSGALNMLKRKEVWICVVAIFLGGASECAMSQWSSSYIEQALGIEKVWGDLFGMALFGLMLGLGRTLYSKIGKNIEKVLLCCAISATACYLIAALSPISIIGLIACALTGFCTSMLWPGSLIVAEKKNPHAGVFIFAMMAAGGDLGASVAPQIIGAITDATTASSGAIALSNTLGITVEQLGMRIGLLAGSLFPLIAIIVFTVIYKNKKKADRLLASQNN